jgi:hypothetical protein
MQQSAILLILVGDVFPRFGKNFFEKRQEATCQPVGRKVL